MFKNLHKQILLRAALVLTSCNIQAVISSPMPAVHHPDATFRVGIAKGPANTVTTTLTPAGHKDLDQDRLETNSLNNHKLPSQSNSKNNPETKNFETKKTKLATTTPQALVESIPTSMGAIILMGGNNNVKHRSYEALVVLVPYNTEQLPIVSDFTKWLYEQQTVNLRKLEEKIAKKTRSLKFNNVKTAIVTRSDLQQYITNTGTSFEHAVNRFAEDLGRYEKIMAHLQFSDLKTATLSKLQSAKK